MDMTSTYNAKGCFVAKPRRKLSKPASIALVYSMAAFIGQGFLLPPAVVAQAGDSSSGSSLKSETPLSSPALKEETPVSSPSSSSLRQETPISSPSVRPETRVTSTERREEKPESHRPAAQASAQPHKSTMLFGRIEQIAGKTGAQFPVLKALTPTFDARSTTPQLKAKATETQLSGTVVNAFPQDYSGNYGGTLTVWRFEQDPVAYQIDASEAKWTAAAIKQGLTGEVNFNFARAANGKITLEPAQISFLVPLQDTYASTQMNQMFSGMQGGQMNGLMQSMMGSMAGSMKVPVQMYLGNVQTNGLETGVSGNQLRSTLLKNEIRELSPGVLEQQLVTYQVSRNAKTGAVEKGYGETVLRFTRQNADQFYVQAAIVEFTEARHFKDKTVLYGTVRKGQVVQQNQPNTLPGFGDMSKIMGLPAGGTGTGSGASSGQMPQMGGDLQEQIKKMLNP
jgi:hypothetical protein